MGNEIHMRSMSPSIREFLNELSAERKYTMKANLEVFQMLNSYERAHKNIQAMQEERKRILDRLKEVEEQINAQSKYIEEVETRFPKLLGEMDFIAKLDQLQLPDDGNVRLYY